MGAAVFMRKKTGRRGQNKFTSRLDGLNRRQAVYVCADLDCMTWHTEGKTRFCMACEGEEFIYFMSTSEAKRYAQLSLHQKHGLISGLEMQVPFPITINGVHITTWKADFVYRKGADRIIEDVKGTQRRAGIDDVFFLKKKLVEAAHGVKINLVTVK